LPIIAGLLEIQTEPKRFNPGIGRNGPAFNAFTPLHFPYRSEIDELSPSSGHGSALCRNISFDAARPFLESRAVFQRPIGCLIGHPAVSLAIWTGAYICGRHGASIIERRFGPFR
jgi:hypothetical protein